MAIEKIENYQKPAKVNPYVEDLKGLKVGDAFAVTVVTKISENTGKVLGLTAEKAAVQAGARANGMTARVMETVTVREAKKGEPGETRYVFQLFDAQKSPERAPKGVKHAK